MKGRARRRWWMIFAEALSLLAFTVQLGLVPRW